MTIKEGLHFDLEDSIYHAQHDWLSSTGIKRLIPPSTPAHFRAAMKGSEHKPAFDFGKAVHKSILGVGEQVVTIDADSWRTKAAQEARDAAYADGCVPLLAAEAERVELIATAVRSHPVAGPLLKGGEPEVSAFWTDQATGVKCRARFDYLHDSGKHHGGPPATVVDVKTTAGMAEHHEFARAALNFGYALQAAHYSDALEALIGKRPRFLFVVVEKDEPYAVNVVEFNDPVDQRVAVGAVDRARRIFAECMAADHWPAYPHGIAQTHIPYLFERLGEFAGLVTTDEVEIA